VTRNRGRLYKFAVAVVGVTVLALAGFVVFHRSGVAGCRGLESSASDRDLKSVAQAAISADRRLAASGDAGLAAAGDPLANRYIDALRSRVPQIRGGSGQERQQFQSLCAQVGRSGALVNAMVRVDIVDSTGQLVSASVERHEVRANHGQSGWFVTRMANPSEFDPRGA
jgi:hypothetical protein